MEEYRQTTEHTCAASSLLMVLHHLIKLPMTVEEEYKIWHASANLPVRASSVYALAIVAKQHGLSPRIVLEEKEYDYLDYHFKGYTKNEIDEAKYSSRLYARQAHELGIPIVQREVTIDEVMSILVKGNIVLLRVNVGVLRDAANHSRYVVAFQDEGEDLFTIIDPQHGASEIDADKLEECMVTLQTKKKRDVRMIVF